MDDVKPKFKVGDIVAVPDRMMPKQDIYKKGIIIEVDSRSLAYSYKIKFFRWWPTNESWSECSIRPIETEFEKIMYGIGE